MAKLTKKEKEKIQIQMSTVERGNTWVGLRPATFVSKKRDKKRRRQESRQLCREFI